MSETELNGSLPATPKPPHSLLGGSSAERWMACPGSAFLAKDLPPMPAGPRAERGTYAHALAERALGSFLLKKLTGEGIPGTVEAVMNEPDQEVAEWVMRYVTLVWHRVLGEFITKKAYGLEDIFTLHEPMDMRGITDFWCVYRDDRAKRFLCIVDFKTGYNRVEASSAQLAFYACAAREELIAHGKDIDYARCIVIQPPLGEEEDYQEVKYTAKKLDAWKKKFIKAGEQIYVKQKPKFKVGSWCTYCPAKAICPIYGKQLAAGSLLGMVDVDEVKLPQVATLPDAALVQIITSRKRIEAYLKEVSIYALSRIREGKPLPGLKVVEGAAKRTWLDDEDAVVKDLLDLGLSKAEIYQTKLKGITAIETLLKNQGMKAGEAKKSLENSVYLKSAALSLVAESDERPAIEWHGVLLTGILESGTSETE